VDLDVPMRTGVSDEMPLASARTRGSVYGHANGFRVALAIVEKQNSEPGLLRFVQPGSKELARACPSRHGESGGLVY
jgi:hypothetical protein